MDHVEGLSKYYKRENEERMTMSEVRVRGEEVGWGVDKEVDFTGLLCWAK